jgi:hypothetical protein
MLLNLSSYFQGNQYNCTVAALNIPVEHGDLENYDLSMKKFSRRPADSSTSNDQLARQSSCILVSCCAGDAGT